MTAPPVARRLSAPEAQRRLTRRRQGKPAQRAGEDKERQRYRTRLDAEAGGATNKLKAAQLGGALQQGLSIDEVVALFRPAPFPWWIAGGWGLDLFLGEQTRPHEDVDVLTLRRDQVALQTHLSGWDLHAADPPGTGSLRPWKPGELLELPIHELWCREHNDDPWQLEVVLADTDNGNWVFRRQTAVTRPLHAFGGTTHDEIPFVAPEILLLFKAKNVRAKDEQDFAATVPRLMPESREWLRQAITGSHPDHPWLGRL